MHRMGLHENISRSPDFGFIAFCAFSINSMAFCKSLPHTVTASFRPRTGFPINSARETYNCKKYYSIFGFLNLIRFYYIFAACSVSICEALPVFPDFCAARTVRCFLPSSAVRLPAVILRVYCSKTARCNIL